MTELIDFIRESNRIEGISREPTEAEIQAHVDLLDCRFPGVADMERFVSVIQPGAKLRRLVGMNVRVGDHVAPEGGPDIPLRLENLLAHAFKHDAYKTHLAYETLHPFMDGNGRSGRALWLWQVEGNAALGFLHRFYYQTLSENRP